MFLVGVGVGVIVGLVVAAWCAVLLVALDPSRFGASRFGKSEPRRTWREVAPGIKPGIA